MTIKQSGVVEISEYKIDVSGFVIDGEGADTRTAEEAIRDWVIDRINKEVAV